MNRNVQFAIGCSSVLFASAWSAAGTVFSDDFNRPLLNPNPLLPDWIGQGGGATSGQIVPAPVDAVTHLGVMNFTQTTLGGDAFSFGASTGFNVVAGEQYTLDFDYIGTPIFGDPNGNGGFIGLSDGLPGNHYWMGGTLGAYLGPSVGTPILNTTPVVITDDNTWHHYSIAFTPNYSGLMHVMVEDFNFVGGPNQPGDAYFDNIRVVAVPLPTAASAGLVLLGVVSFSKVGSMLSRKVGTC